MTAWERPCWHLLRIKSQFLTIGRFSLEPGPFRARYFPRDMLLLTTTARERAWRLLKITGPLIGWLDGDSPIPGVSPWLAPLSRCTVYIVEVQRTSELIFLRLQNSNSQMASTIVVDREGVVCEKLHALQGQLESRNCYVIWRRRCVTSSMLDPTCNAAFLFVCLWGPVSFFFFWKPCRSNRGPSRNSGWVHRNWGPFEEICWAQTTKLGHAGGFRKREHKAFCMLTCMVPADSLDNRWSEMIRAPGTKPTPWQRCKWRLVFDCVSTLTRVSIQLRKRAKILKIISQKTD